MFHCQISPNCGPLTRCGSSYLFLYDEKDRVRMGIWYQMKEIEEQTRNYMNNY